MAGGGQRSQVYADIPKNRLYIVLKGMVTRKETEGLYTDIRFIVSDLTPGFNVITDMTEGRIGHLSGVPVFKKIADYLLASEVGTIVRVTGEQTVMSKQLRKLTELIQGYTPVYVTSMDEVESVLKKMEEG